VWISISSPTAEKSPSSFGVNCACKVNLLVCQHPLLITALSTSTSNSSNTVLNQL